MGSVRQWAIAVKALAVCLICLCATSARAIDRTAFTFTKYNLKVGIIPEQGALDVSGSVELRNDSKEPQSAASLQISSSLEWRGITIKGEPVGWLSQTYTSDIDHTGVLSEAIVKFDEPIAPGKSVTLDVHYSGTVPRDATRLTRIGTPEKAALRVEWDQIGREFTAFRGLGYVTWYPVEMDAVSLSNGNEVFEAIAAWKQRHRESAFRVEFDMRTALKGVSILSTAARDKPSGEIALDGPSPVVAIGKFEHIARPEIDVYHLLDHTSLARDYTVGAESALKVSSEWFGRQVQPMTIVELVDSEALPFEAGSYLFTPLKSAPQLSLEAGLARSAFYTSAIARSRRPWIADGLATLAQALVREHQAGRKAGLAYLNQFVNALGVAETMPVGNAAEGESSSKTTVAPHEPLVTTSDQLFLRTKAGFVWWMLRDMVGDDALKKAIADYKPEDDHEPSYMQRLLEKAAPARHDLEAFFDSWVYRDRGLADFRISAVYPRKLVDSKKDASAGWLVTVTVENMSDVWAEVPVTIRSDGGEQVGRVAVEAHKKAVARIPISSEPKEAVVNDGSIPEVDLDGNRVEVHAADTTQPK